METFLTLVNDVNGKRCLNEAIRCELDVNHISAPVSLLPDFIICQILLSRCLSRIKAVKCRKMSCPLGNQTLCVYCTIHRSQEGVQGCSEQQW